MLFIGPEAEKRFGRWYSCVSPVVFTGSPEFTALTRRSYLGRIDPSLLTEAVPGGRRFLQAGWPMGSR